MEVRHSIFFPCLLLLCFYLELSNGADTNIWSKETLCWTKKRGVCISTAVDNWKCPGPWGKTWWKGCPKGYICCVGSTQSDPTNFAQLSGSCGFPPKDRGSDTSFRIVGGYHVPLGQLPWQVLLRMSRESFGGRLPSAYCGGSIIDKDWVLTAAHCFDEKEVTTKTLRLVTGLTDQRESTRTDIPRVQIFTAEKIIKHEKYNDTDYRNDIALVKLAKPVRFDNFSAPICLPRQKQNFVNHICTASGWGVMSAKRSILSPQLRALHIPVIPWERCKRTHLAKSADNTIFNHNICVNFVGGGRDPCDGDSGGPLACRMSTGQHILAGITSWGDADGCARGLPSVLTDVQAFLCWIKEKTGLPVVLNV